MKKPKFKVGDIVASGPFVIRKDGGRAASDPVKGHELAKLSAKYGPHMIVAKVMGVSEEGIHVAPIYLTWAKHIESADEIGGLTYLPADSDDYASTRLYDREVDNTDTMIEFLVVDALGKDKP